MVKESMYCFACGAEISIHANMCPKCGAAQKKTSANGGIKKGRSKVVAALLAMFLGYLGAHRFYLGSNGWGVAYLLFGILTLGIGFVVTALVGFIEGLIYLGMSDEAFEEKYNGEQ